MEVLWIPLIIFYDEMVVRFTTIGRPSFSALAFTVFFSAAYGLLLAVPGKLFEEGRARRIINHAVIILLTAFYLTMCFIHLQFKVFYDVSTVLNGAGGVVTHYRRDIWLLIKSAAGTRSIILLLLPVFVRVFVPRIVNRLQKNDPLPSAANTAYLEHIPAIKVFAGSIAIFLLTAVCASLGVKSRIPYYVRYEYQSAISSFGLLTGLRLDVVHMFKNAVNAEAFEEIANTDETPDTDADIDTEDVETEDEEPVYGYSMLDIDFDALQEAGGIYAEIDAYVQTLTPSHQNRYTGIFAGKNLIFISAEAFSGYVIDEELTPVLYRMMTKGIYIKDFYQAAGAGTIGGEYQNLFGVFPTAGGASMLRKVSQHNYLTLGWQLDHLGYFGQAFHNGDVAYYDRDKTHNALGYSEGFLAHWNGLETLMNEDTIYSDREMARATVPLYLDKEPFNIYYMTISGHSPYGWHVNHFSARHMERVQGLPYSDEVKSYIAAHLEVEDMMAYLLDALEEKGIADDTVIVLSPDHFPYGLSYQGLENLYGHPANTNFERDKNAAIIWCGSIEEEQIEVDTPVSSIDLLPTLLNLFGLPWDSRLLPGRDILSDAAPVAFNAAHDWKTDLGTYTAATGVFTPAQGVSEKDIPEGYVEEIKAMVRNKNVYCQRLTEYDYFYHVFGDDGPWGYTRKE